MGISSTLTLTVYLNGYHGDTSRTIRVGKVSEQVETLCRVTEDALEAAIKIVKPGVAFTKNRRDDSRDS